MDKDRFITWAVRNVFYIQWRAHLGWRGQITKTPGGRNRPHIVELDDNNRVLHPATISIHATKSEAQRAAAAYAGTQGEPGEVSSNGTRAGVYLIHLDAPLAPGRHTAQHYIGYAADLDRRFTEHTQGRGARFLAVAAERGIGIRLARVWLGAGRQEERYLKNRHAGARLCPVCSPRALQWATTAAPRPKRERAPLPDCPF